jgi:hypothetical protein
MTRTLTACPAFCDGLHHERYRVHSRDVARLRNDFTNDRVEVAIKQYGDDAPVVSLTLMHDQENVATQLRPTVATALADCFRALGSLTLVEALTEACAYDAEGQLLSGTLSDYCIPRAQDLPYFKIDTRETPCTHNPLGVKGCGEAGAIGAPAAVMNAITDALGVKDVPMPATAQTVWRSLQKKAA